MKSLLTLLAALFLLATAERAGADTATLHGMVSSGAQNRRQHIAGAAVTVYRAETTAALAVGDGVSDGNGYFNIEVTTCACDGILYAVADVGHGVMLATIIGPAINGDIMIDEMTTVATAYAMVQFFNDQGAIVGKPLPLTVAAGIAEELVSQTTGLPSTVIENPPNAYQTNTWQELGTLANILAGCVHYGGGACTELFTLTGTTSGPAPPTTLQAMINIAHHPATNVEKLFDLGEFYKIYDPSLGEANGPKATDFLQRLDAFTVAIKVNATQLPPTSNEQCPFSGPGNIAFDLQGYAWITNNMVQGTPGSAQCQIVLKPNGQPSDGTNNRPKSPLLGGGLLGQGFGISLDPFGNVWSGNFGWGHVYPKDASGNVAGSDSEFTLQGTAVSGQYGYTASLCRVQGVASDSAGNIWSASWGNDTVEVFPQGNPNPPFVVHREQDTQPFGVAIDGDGAGWVSNEGKSTLSKFTLTNNQLVRQFEVPVSTTVPPPEHVPENPQPNPCFPNLPNDHPKPPSVHPKGLAIDQEGNAWVVASAVDKVSAFDKIGHPLGSFGGGGVVGPWGVAVDSRDNVWVANFGGVTQLGLKYHVSELCGAAHNGCTNTGEPMTQDTGYTLPSGGDEVLLHNGKPLYYPLALKTYKPMMRLTDVVIDMAGNLWAINNFKPDTIVDTVGGDPGGDGIVIFVGLAAPVMPVPYSAPPRAP